MAILSIIFHVIYGAVYIQLSHLFLDEYENRCTLSYNYHQIGSMTHLLLFRVRSWNNGILCMFFYILINDLSIESHILNQLFQYSFTPSAITIKWKSWLKLISSVNVEVMLLPKIINCHNSGGGVSIKAFIETTRQKSFVYSFAKRYEKCSHM